MAGTRRLTGFTLIEMLVVLSVIIVLLGLVGIVAKIARDKARESNAKTLVKRLQLALDVYKAHNRAYPPLNSETWPAPYSRLGVDFDCALIASYEDHADLSTTDLDPAKPSCVLDPWKQRIRYRKVSPERILIWSIGPNKYDDIGNAPKPVERAEDDISNVAADY